MKQGLFKPFLVIIVLIATTIGIIAYGRGYRLNIKKKTIQPTGLLVATSTPDGAEIFINGNLTSATNTTLNLPPGEYEVKIVKEGFIPWEKKLKIQGEIVTKVDALLFPAAPSLRAITSTGALNPALSPDGTKLVFGVSKENGSVSKNQGVWVLDLSTRALRFTVNSRQIAKDGPEPLSGGRFIWSPSSKQVLVEIKQLKEKPSRFYLLDIDKLNSPPQNVTATISLLKERWETEFKAQEEKLLLSLKSKPDLYNFATSSAKVLSFSPDETKILYQAKNSITLPKIIIPPLIGTNPTKETREIKTGKIYVYDIKEDKNYEIRGVEIPKLKPNKTKEDQNQEGKALSLEFKKALPLQWYPDSRHLILVEADKISILGYDGENKAVVYSSSFENKFVAPWPDGSRLIILTSLNPEASQESNLYTINLR